MTFTPKISQQPASVSISNGEEIKRRDEWERWRLEQKERKIQQERELKQKRILESNEDKYIHALNTIIERFENNNSVHKEIDFGINYYYFNFEDRGEDIRIFKNFLDQLKNYGCFERFEKTTNVINGLSFYFIEIKIEKLNEYKRKLLAKEDNLELTKQEIKNNEKLNPSKKPVLKVEEGIGYLKYDKNGEKIKIGSITTRKYRLLKCLIDTLGINKTINSVFEKIFLSKDKTNTRLSGYDELARNNEKINIIKGTIKNLQKDNKLRGLKFEIDESKLVIRLKYLE